MKKVYTIGYDARDFVLFINILQHYSIKAVIDVRRFPKSRFSTYNRSYLEEELPHYGIKYYWLGDKLGGFRGDYIEYMKTRSFMEGFNLLRRIIDKHLETKMFSVIMCREKIPWRCHRRFISSLLHDLGYRIYHIIDLGNIIEHKYSVKKYGLDLNKLFPDHRLD